MQKVSLSPCALPLLFPNSSSLIWNPSMCLSLVSTPFEVCVINVFQTPLFLNVFSGKSKTNWVKKSKSNTLCRPLVTNGQIAFWHETNISKKFYETTILFNSFSNVFFRTEIVIILFKRNDWNGKKPHSYCFSFFRTFIGNHGPTLNVLTSKNVPFATFCFGQFFTTTFVWKNWRVFFLFQQGLPPAFFSRKLISIQSSFMFFTRNNKCMIENFTW